MPTHDDRHLTALYRDSFPDFARLVRRMGGSLEQAKDCFHDALLIYLEKENSGNLQLHSSPKAWLLGTARICWLQTLKKQPAVSLPADLEETPDAPECMEAEESLLRSLLRTGKKCLDLLKAFYYDNSSMQDIAEKFGFNGRRSATVQKYKCLEKLRAEIKTDLCAVN